MQSNNIAIDNDTIKQIDGLIAYKTRNCFFPSYYEQKDLKQDIMYNIFNRINTYNIDRGSLTTWIYNIIESTIKNFFKAQTTEKTIPEFLFKRITSSNTPSSYEEAKIKEIGEENLKDTNFELNPFNYVWEKELINKLKENLTSFQKVILKAKLDPPQRLKEMAINHQQKKLNKKNKLQNNSRYCEVIRITNEMIANYYKIGLQEVRTALKHIEKNFNNIVTI